jgi:hypothetical protein
LVKSHEITTDNRATEFFFSPIKSPNSSRKSIKKNWKSGNQCFIISSFIESKKSGDETKLTTSFILIVSIQFKLTTHYAICKWNKIPKSRYFDTFNPGISVPKSWLNVLYIIEIFLCEKCIRDVPFEITHFLQFWDSSSPIF